MAPVLYLSLFLHSYVYSHSLQADHIGLGNKFIHRASVWSAYFLPLGTKFLVGTFPSRKMISRQTQNYISDIARIGAYVKFLSFRFEYNRKRDICTISGTAQFLPECLLLLAMSIKVGAILNCVFVLCLQKLQNKEVVLVLGFIAILCLLLGFQLFHWLHLENIRMICNNFFKLNQHFCKS